MAGRLQLGWRVPLPYAFNRNPRLTWNDYLLWIARVQNQAIVLLGVDGQVATWTRGAGQLLGHGPEDIVGRHFSVLYAAEDIALGKPESDLAAAIERGELTEEGLRNRKSGARFHARSTLTALFDDHGQLRGFGLSLLDVSDHHRTEHELRRAVSEAGTKESGIRPAVVIPAANDETEAARRREEHATCLARATSTLSSSLDYEAMLRALAGLLAPGLADFCVVHLLSEGQLRNVAAAPTHPVHPALANGFDRAYPPSEVSERGAWNVLRNGSSELVQRVDEATLRPFALDRAHLDQLLRSGVASLLIVPIRMRERVSGTISLVSHSAQRRYDQYDLLLAEEIGRRAGAAIENAKLYVAEKKAREQLELLAKAGETLASTFDYEDTLRQVVAITLPALADFSFFDVVEGGEVRRIAAAYDPALDAAVKDTTWTHLSAPAKNLCALGSGVAGLHSQIDEAFWNDIATSPEHLALLKKLQLGSLLTVPLISRSELLGSLTLCFGASGRHHTMADLKLAEELARRAAIAVVQARLYDNARSAAARAEEAARQAEEAGRIKDEFLATVSHELRTPLNAILGWASLLQKRGVDPSAAKGIDVIHRNAEAQGKIIEDILDASRIITGKLRLDLRPSLIAKIAHDAIEVVRPSADAKGIVIDFSPPEVMPSLLADPDRLQQVIWNLLSNAVKFTDAGGRVVVRMGHGEGGVFLSVADTGRGIEPDFLPHVFERFRQADSSTTRRVGGLGLGLAIVRQIVELHGGQVEAISAGPGAGSTFTLTLPLRSSVMPEPPDTDEPTLRRVITATERRPTSLSGLRVLVVDDEGDARDLVGTLLREAGAVVETAASAAEGFERLSSFAPHVLVSDVGMPDEDGHAFMRRIRALDPALGGSIPSIALTAYTRGEDRAKALAVGFTTHIGKPVNSDALLGAVSNLARLSQRPVKT